MSTRMTLRPQSVISNGDMSGNLVSDPTILQALTIGTYTFEWAGASPVGTIQFQVSNNYSLNQNGTVKNPGTWVTGYVFDPSTQSWINQIPVSGNTGEGVIEFSSGAYAVRVIYTATSGTGALQAVINGKVA
mgnify:CR=1 FL=1